MALAQYGSIAWVCMPVAGSTKLSEWLTVPWLNCSRELMLWYAFHWFEWMIVPGFTTCCMSFPLIWMDNCPWFYNTLYELSTDLNGWLSLVLQHVVWAFHWFEWMIVPGFTTRCMSFPLIWMDDCPWFYNTLYELSTDLNGWLSLVLQHVVWAFHWFEWMIVPGFTTRCMSFPLIWMDDCPWFYNTLYNR